MSEKTATCRLLLLGMVLVSSWGCGAEQKSWGTVSGAIIRNGKPIEPAIVLFSNRAAGVEITAETNASGEFTMRTDQIKGLPVGTYKVAVIPKPVNLPLPEQGMIFKGPPPEQSESKIPLLDQDVNTTRLAATVKEGRNEFTFELQP